MMQHTPTLQQSPNYEQRNLMIATTIGSIFEIFDFIAFVFLSPILAKVFFPADSEHSAIWFTYLTITVSYLLRPIGGIILGHLGDRYGRKSVFSLSIFLMAIPSLAIALLPSFASIGWAAPCFLVILRILQGFSVGGEVPGSITYIAEKFRTQNYYLACAWLTFGANLAVALGSFAIRLLSEFSSTEFMHSYGFRIPFLIGSLLSVIGFYIRKRISESEGYLQIQAHKQLNTAPALTILKNQRPALITGILLAITVSLTTSVFHVFLPNLLVSYFHLELTNAAKVSSAGALTLALASLVFAYSVRWLKPLTLVKISLTLLALIFLAMSRSWLALNQLSHLYTSVILISALVAGINGVFFGLLADLFPTQVRYSGVAICYNMAYILGAGITPLWTSSLIAINHSYTAIAGVCLVVTMVALVNSFYLGKFLIHTPNANSN